MGKQRTPAKSPKPGLIADNKCDMPSNSPKKRKFTPRAAIDLAREELNRKG
jgi:hypothetical protein